jgi:hypothetical protein
MAPVFKKVYNEIREEEVEGEAPYICRRLIM